MNKSLSTRDDCFYKVVSLSDSYRYSLFSHYLDLAIKLVILFDRNKATKIPTFLTQIYLLQLHFTLDSIDNCLLEHLVKLGKHKIVDTTTLNLILF